MTTESSIEFNLAWIKNNPVQYTMSLFKWHQDVRNQFGDLLCLDKDESQAGFITYTAKGAN
jgi:hypothetical protein